MLLSVLYNVEEIGDKHVIAVCTVESVITIGPARNKFQRAQLAKLILDRGKPKTTHSHQFAHISFLMGRCEKQSQQLRAHLGEQHFQDGALFFHLVGSYSNSTV